MDQLGIGVIGCGAWGRNHVRTFASLDGCIVRRAADPLEERLGFIKRRFASVAATRDPAEVIHADDVNAVVIATPTATHYSLTKEALEAGNHVLCEKPLALRTGEAEDLTVLAESKGLTLLVGHVFMYNPGIVYLKEQIDGGVLGRIHYMDSVRTNLGPIRDDVGAIYDLASHDISIFNFLLGGEPTKVAAQCGYYTQPGREDMAYLTLEYPSKTISHAHVSWLNPRKVRQLTVVGDKKMAVWDDMVPLETIRLYDKGFHEPPHYDSFGQFQISVRDADVTIPKVEMFEPLRKEAEHFVTCVRERRRPLSDGHNGVAVVRVLEAAMESLRQDGRSVAINPDGPRLGHERVLPRLDRHAPGKSGRHGQPERSARDKKRADVFMGAPPALRDDD